MTQTFTYLSQHFVVQASDRLLSRDAIPWDATTNKSVVLATRDALVGLSFTGTGFIDGLPTDEWIVAQLLRDGISRPAGELPFLCEGSRLVNPYVGPSLALLRDRLLHSLSFRHAGAEIHRMPFGLTIAGWQLTKKQRFRPAHWVIVKESVHWPPRLLSGRRHLGRGRVVITAPAMHDSLSAPFVDQIDRATSLDEVENAATALIRQAATLSPGTVGRDSMVIFLPRPDRATPSPRFVPDQWQEKQWSAPGGSRVPTSVGYSPWLVGVNCWYSPQEMVGTVPTWMSGRSFMLVGPPGDVHRSGFIYGVSTQERRRPPRPGQWASPSDESTGDEK